MNSRQKGTECEDPEADVCGGGLVEIDRVPFERSQRNDG
jgi:hypothetical protein